MTNMERRIASIDTIFKQNVTHVLKNTPNFNFIEVNNIVPNQLPTVVNLQPAFRKSKNTKMFFFFFRKRLHFWQLGVLFFPLKVLPVTSVSETFFTHILTACKPSFMLEK